MKEETLKGRGNQFQLSVKAQVDQLEPSRLCLFNVRPRPHLQNLSENLQLIYIHFHLHSTCVLLSVSPWPRLLWLLYVSFPAFALPFKSRVPSHSDMQEHFNLVRQEPSTTVSSAAPAETTFDPNGIPDCAQDCYSQARNQTVSFDCLSCDPARR